jgi:hypothetical protein
VFAALSCPVMCWLADASPYPGRSTSSRRPKKNSIEIFKTGSVGNVKINVVLSLSPFSTPTQYMVGWGHLGPKVSHTILGIIENCRVLTVTDFIFPFFHPISSFWSKTAMKSPKVKLCRTSFLHYIQYVQITTGRGTAHSAIFTTCSTGS